MKNIKENKGAEINQSQLNVLNNVVSRRLFPILKWAGGKEQELKYILPNMPTEFTNYYEPFVGGGAVYTAVQAKNYFINDKSDELISLYRSIINENRDTFFAAVEELIKHWDFLTEIVERNATPFITNYRAFTENKIDDKQLKEYYQTFSSDHAETFKKMFSNTFNFNHENFLKEININLLRKSKRMKELEGLKTVLSNSDILNNIETALKSAFYMHLRHIYNYSSTYQITPEIHASLFLFIRNFAYSGMFRYNANGEFNVPYGGIAYNRKNFQKKVDYLRTEELKSHLDQTTIENLDFEVFFNVHQPTKNDFIFLDPPYDSEFSTYANNAFTKEDQTRLANYLIHKCKAKWMMIIKNTDFIYQLYNHEKLNIRTFDKTYLVSFMNRNDKNVKHLLITNY
jgi:DNA adenine methylase